MPRVSVRPADIASLMVLFGLIGQGFALYSISGAALAAGVIGTEVALLGLVGVLRA